MMYLHLLYVLLKEDQQEPHFIISSWTDRPHSLSLSPCTLCSSPCPACCSLLGSSHCRNIYLNQGAPDWTQHSDLISLVPNRGEGSLPWSCTLANAAHGGSPLMQGLAGNHAQFVEYKDVQDFFRTAFQPVCPQHELSFLFFALCRIWHLPMLIFMTFLSAHLSKGRISLNGNLVLYHIHQSPWLVSIQKLAENLLWYGRIIYRRNHLQGRERHSALRGTSPQPRLNSSCPWSECQSWITRHLLRLMSVQGDSHLMHKKCSAVATLTDKGSGMYFQNPFSSFFCSYIKAIYEFVGRNHSSGSLISVNFPNRKRFFFPGQLSLFFFPCHCKVGRVQ